MNRGTDTGFKDKANRMIHVDDILQHRLGTFGKSSGGPRNSRVIDFHGKFQLVPENQNDTKFGGNDLTSHLCQFLVVLRCNHIPS